MPLALSSVYESAELMREQLSDHLNDGEQEVVVTIGQPFKAAEDASDDKPVLNLFFYKIQPPGFFPDTGPNETWRARLHCLVTAFGTSDNEGADELKIIGQVLSYFHEHPTLRGTTEESETFYWLEVVFQPLTSEEINQIWSTFGNVTYRTSLTYEVALIPVEPKVKAIPAPPVVSGGATRNVGSTAEPTYASPPLAPVDAEIGRIEVDLSRSDWAPAIAFIEDGEASPSLTRSLSEVEPNGNGTVGELWIAGEKNAKVDLIVQSGVSGSWIDLPDLLAEQKDIPDQTELQNQLTVDPSADLTQVVSLGITKAEVEGVKLKIKPAPSTDLNASTQFLIYARRILADGSSVKSNPLILNITGSQHAAEDGP